MCACVCVCVEPETNILSTAAASSAPDPLLTLLPGAHLGTSTFDMRCRLVTAGVAAPEEVQSNIYMTSDPKNHFLLKYIAHYLGEWI